MKDSIKFIKIDLEMLEHFKKQYNLKCDEMLTKSFEYEFSSPDYQYYTGYMVGLGACKTLLEYLDYINKEQNKGETNE
jgi:hypothetical protein